MAENSHAAMSAAVAAGAAYIETDCHVTSDGVVVLFHDSDLRRVLADQRSVSDVRHAELRDLMSGKGGLITLQDMLEEFSDTRLNLDVKAPLAAEPAGRIIARHGARVLLTSFDDRRCRRALAAAMSERGAVRPAMSPGRAGLIRVLSAVASGAPRLMRLALREIDALQIPERYGRMRVFTPSLVRAARAHGVEVHIWTVNDLDRMRLLVARGAQGIITDQADAALEEFGRAG